jgi:hypothetical protein
MSNSKTREIFKRAQTQRAKAAQKAGVKLIAGPLFSTNHKSIVVTEASKVESVVDMLTELHVPQWNSVDIQPYLSAEDAEKMVDAQKAIY